MTPFISGLGCATPAHSATQPASADFAILTAGLEGHSARFAEAIYRKSGIARRSIAVLRSTAPDDAKVDQAFFERRADALDRGPGTAARMNAYAALAPPIAAAAARRALDDARSIVRDIGPAAITHLITVSCTGFAAPGIDIALIDELGLSRNVERLHIGFMGCHGGIIGLRTACAIAAAAHTTANVLLVCVELCSLHMQYSDRPDQIVANALFGDGAAAVLVSNADVPVQARPLRLRSASSRLFDDSLGAMGWTIGDHGFEMALAESVPDLLKTSLAAWLGPWLESCGLSLDRARTVALWAIHPGGPRVLDAVGDALDLLPSALSCSRSVLSDFGNTSSPSVLFILERLLAADNRSDAPIVMLGFGPGLTAEAILLAR